MGRARQQDIEFTPTPPDGLPDVVVVEHALRRLGPNPFVGALVHALRRRLDKRPVDTPLESALDGDGAFERLVSLSLVEGALERLERVPEDVLRRVSPAALHGADVDVPATFPDRAEVARALDLLPDHRRVRASSSHVVGRAVTAVLRRQLDVAKRVDASTQDLAGLHTLGAANPTVDLDTLWGFMRDWSRPRIHGMTPSSGAQPGHPVTLIGERFANNPGDNQLRLYERAPDGSLQLSAQQATVSASSPTGLTFVLPTAWDAGHYGVRVAVPGLTTSTEPLVSEPFLFTIKLPVPTITGISPANPEPGHLVTIHGTGFQPTMTMRLEATQGQFDAHKFFETGDGDLTYESSTQLTLRVPTLNDPGHYRFRVRETTPFVSSGLWSEWNNDLDVRPARFRVIFDRFHCYATTSESTSDELIFAFTIGADGHAWGRTTTEYGSIDYRPWKPYGFTAEEGHVFPIGGGDGAIAQHLYVAVQMWENDNLDEGHAIVKYLGKTAAHIHEYQEDPYTGSVAAYAPLVDDAISLLEWLFGGLHKVGAQAVFHRAWELTHHTAVMGGSLPIWLTHFWMQGADYRVEGRIDRIP